MAHFTELRAPHGRQRRGWVHVWELNTRTSSPGEEQGSRSSGSKPAHKEKLEAGQKKPTAEVKEPPRGGKLLGTLRGASRCGSSACTPTSWWADEQHLAERAWHDVRSARSASSSMPVCPNELELLHRTCSRERALTASGLLATHADMGSTLSRRLAFPAAAGSGLRDGPAARCGSGARRGGARKAGARRRSTTSTRPRRCRSARVQACRSPGPMRDRREEARLARPPTATPADGMAVLDLVGPRC